MGPAAGGKYEMVCRKEINIIILGHGYDYAYVSVYIGSREIVREIPHN